MTKFEVSTVLIRRMCQDSILFSVSICYATYTDMQDEDAHMV